ncbi:MAG: radical SAM protein [Alphaproteobacteria bacterium]|nr:radical SAM protein [Alphaproteobacteria bacterium]
MSSYKHSLSLTSQLFFCSIPLRLDSYNRCQFGCAFCFAKSRGGNVTKPEAESASTTAFSARLERVKDGIIKSALDEMIEQRIPIQLGGMTDPFSPWEASKGITKTILQVANKHNYPIVFSTKGTLIGDPEYLGLVKDGNYYVRISMTGAEPKLAASLEKGVSSIEERLALITKLAKSDINVSVRLQPIIPTQEPHISSLIQRIASAGAKHISVEYLKWPIEKNSNQSNALDKIMPDGKAFYVRNGATRSGREYVLPAKYKLPHLRELKDIAEKCGLVFGYADNEFLHLNNFKSCCNAADLFLKNANFFEANLLGAIKNRSPQNKITLNSITTKWFPKNSINPYLNSTMRTNVQIQDSGDWQNIIATKWNSDTWRGGPNSFYGVEDTSELDLNGNKIYSLSTD